VSEEKTDSLHRVSGRRTMKTIVVALRAFVYMTGFLILWGWVALRVRVFDRNLGISLPAGMKTLGFILLAVGGILALTCAGTFVRWGRGTPAPFDAPREFVAIGPYRYVRNPMYIGALTVLVGFGLYQRSPSILLLSLVLFLLVHLFVVLLEEPGLKARFGVTYGEYLKAVPRWVPRVRR
jgi:protein-S-isoprenylcysteine O-methyltransferase Ste14